MTNLKDYLQVSSFITKEWINHNIQRITKWWQYSKESFHRLNEMNIEGVKSLLLYAHKEVLLQDASKQLFVHYQSKQHKNFYINKENIFIQTAICSTFKQVSTISHNNQLINF